MSTEFSLAESKLREIKNLISSLITDPALTDEEIDDLLDQVMDFTEEKVQERFDESMQIESDEDDSDTTDDDLGLNLG